MQADWFMKEQGREFWTIGILTTILKRQKSMPRMYNSSLISMLEDLTQTTVGFEIC